MSEEVTKMNICMGECSCCIGRIYSSINNHEPEWKEMEGKKLTDTPLHRAAAAGNTAVTVEILNLMPSLGRKLNPEGLSPLHVAVKEMQTKTAEALASFDKQLVRVKGKGGVTPPMQCAAQDSCELLARLLLECPESVVDVNNKNQTVLHVAMENGRCKVACMVIDWLRRTDCLSSVLSVRDVGGNTALHAAAESGCYNGAMKLVGLMKLNSRNSKHQTALDIAEEKGDAAKAEGKKKVADLLRNKGARRCDELSNHETMVDYILSKPTFAENISRYYFYLTQELTLEMRSTVLVVATLIIAATYQVVLQPPAGIYPPPEEEIKKLAAPPPAKHHLAGQMVMRLTQYRYFMPLNTFAFALSAVIIIFVVPGTPIFMILHICLVFMCLSYLLALDSISYYTNISNMIYFMALYAIFGAFIVKLWYYPVKALLVEEDWWLRGFSVSFANFWSRAGRDRATYAKPLVTITDRMKKQHRVLYRK